MTSAERFAFIALIAANLTVIAMSLCACAVLLGWRP